MRTSALTTVFAIAKNRRKAQPFYHIKIKYMSISHHLTPVNLETGKFQRESGITGERLQFPSTDFSTFSLMMILYPEKVLPYFGRDKDYYDFIFSFKNFEVSEDTYDPSEIRFKLIEIINTLREKSGFPLGNYYYYDYEDAKSLNFLYVNLLGSELNKIVEDKIYEEFEPYDISTTFDEFNQASNLQRKIEISIRNKEGNRTKTFLNLDAFPSTIEINKVERDYGFGKEIKKVHLSSKEPLEHFQEEIDRLIKVCDICIEHRLGLKSHVN